MTVHDFAIFFIIVSIGRLSNRKTKMAETEIQGSCDDEYAQARSMIHLCFETPSEASVQTVLLHVRSLYLHTSSFTLTRIDTISTVPWQEWSGMDHVRPCYPCWPVPGASCEQYTRY
jgi:hypothetical protein